MTNPSLALKIMFLIAATSALTACKNGGDLSLEPGVRRPVVNKGSPYVQVNLGGKAQVVQNGFTPTTGIHGWVTIQPVATSQLQSGNGTTLIIHKARAYE